MQRLLLAGCRLLAAKACNARLCALDPAANNSQPATSNLLRLVALALLLAACSREPQRTLPHDAYIWQRQWTPAVTQAVAAQAPQFAGWRVLALQVVGESTVEVLPDIGALRDTQLPVLAVVRIEGVRAPLPVARLWTHLGPLLERWSASGVRVAGIEIDHDCASAALADYAQWLRGLRVALPPAYALSITALPTWLESPELEALLAAADASVLQVHAVDRPQQGLFDGVRARGWIDAWAARTRRPFLVALPAYGVRVDVDATGAVRAVDAEGPMEHTGAAGFELRADPRSVAQLLADVGADPPQALTGWVWFRLPVSGDARGWSARTLGAVIAGVPLQSNFVVLAKPMATGASDLRLRNDGNLDAATPIVELPAHCRHGDALGRYRLDYDGGTLRLTPADASWLAAGESMTLGWARCAQPLEAQWSVR